MSYRPPSNVAKLAALGFFGLVAFTITPATWSAGSTPVTVVNSPANPIPVTSSQGTPFATRVNYSSPNGSFNNYTVPAGVVAHIEFIDYLCFTDSFLLLSLRLSTQTGGNSQNKDLPPLAPTSSGGFAFYLYAQNVSLYADAGSTVLILPFAKGAGSVLECYADLSGRLISSP